MLERQEAFPGARVFRSFISHMLAYAKSEIISGPGIEVRIIIQLNGRSIVGVEVRTYLKQLPPVLHEPNVDPRLSREQMKRIAEFSSGDKSEVALRSRKNLLFHDDNVALKVPLGKPPYVGYIPTGYTLHMEQACFVS